MAVVAAVAALAFCDLDLLRLLRANLARDRLCLVRNLDDDSSLLLYAPLGRVMLESSLTWRAVLLES